MDKLPLFEPCDHCGVEEAEHWIKEGKKTLSLCEDCYEDAASLMTDLIVLPDEKAD